MGGVLINGCGWSDSYEKIKDLGTFPCPFCKKTQVMSLKEVKTKAKIIFIPVANISTKYIVACSGCGKGYYVDENQKNDLLYDKSIAVMTSEGLLISKKKPVSVIEQKKKPDPSPQIIRRFCSKCGSELASDGKCPKCDAVQPKPIISDDGGQPNQNTIVSDTSWMSSVKLKRKICPSCGLLYGAEKENCTVCGKTLIERV